MGSLKRKSPEEPSSSTLQPLHDCVHHVSYPDGYNNVHASSSSPTHTTTSEPAKNFPFPLDPFQSKSISCLENGESVMVCLQIVFYFVIILLWFLFSLVFYTLRSLHTPLLGKPWWHCMLLPCPSVMASAWSTLPLSRLSATRSTENSRKNSPTLVWWPETSQLIPMLLAWSWLPKSGVACNTKALSSLGR